MWDIIDFLVIFVVISSVKSAEVDSMENTFNCYTDYLKRHGVLETSFKSEPFNGESMLCEVVLSTTVDGVYSALFDEFNKTEEFDETAATCIVDNLKKAKWSDLDIKEQVFEFSELLNDEEKIEKIRELKQLQGKISSEAIVSCLATQQFGELFDDIFHKDDEVDFVGDYCARMYALDNKLIDTNIHHINPNPNGLITNEIKCDVINKQHFDEAEIELRQHLLKDIHENDAKVDCLIRKYHENHYFNKTLAVELLGELSISDDQKKIERSKFIDSMINITKTLSEC